MNTVINGIKGIPTIKHIMPLGLGTILPRLVSSRSLARTEEMSEDECAEYDMFYVHPDYVRFYELQLIAGNDFKPVSEDNRTDVIINEAMAKALGLKEPVGKTLINVPKPYYFNGNVLRNGVEYSCLIVGVVKNFVYDSPIVQVDPVVMSCQGSFLALGVKYQPETYSETKKAIEEYVEKNFPEKQANIFKMDDEYKIQYASEASLRMSLTLLSLICIIISLFGIYSAVYSSY